MPKKLSDLSESTIEKEVWATISETCAKKCFLNAKKYVEEIISIIKDLQNICQKKWRLIDKYDLLEISSIIVNEERIFSLVAKTKRQFENYAFYMASYPFDDLAETISIDRVISLLVPQPEKEHIAILKKLFEKNPSLTLP